MTPAAKSTAERVIGAVALLLAALGPLIFSDYWVSSILTQTFLMGVAAASLIFLSAYGGMVSLGQVVARRRRPASRSGTWSPRPSRRA